MSAKNVGILGIGAHLPDEVRKNDWWPKDVVDRWRKKSADVPLEQPRTFAPETESERLVLAAVNDLRGDPFGGAVERRILPKDLHSSDMEVAAARDALQRAAIKPEQIEFIIGYSSVSDYLATPNACAIHERLGLPKRCLTTAIDAACNSFNQQLTLAQGMIESGRYRYGLLTQSCNISLLVPSEQPASTWFGDAATAIVLGPVGENRGILGATHRVDGSCHSLLVTGVPGKRWYEEGRIQWYPTDRARAKRVLFDAVTYAQQVIPEALSDVGYRPDQVDFYAAHQTTGWMRRVTQEASGLTNARFIDTYKWTANLGACNIPFCLAMGEREGILREGDLVSTFSPGNGITWSSAVLRWGR